MPSKGVTLEGIAAHKTFDTQYMNREVFEPRFYLEYEDEGLSEKFEPTSFQTEFLAKTLEGAKTAVFVKTANRSVGKYVKGTFDKKDAGTAWETSVTICLVDLSKPERRRVMIGVVSPPDSKSSTGGTLSGGVTRIDRVEYYATDLDQADLLEHMLRVAMQKKKGYMGTAFKGGKLYETEKAK